MTDRGTPSLLPVAQVMRGSSCPVKPVALSLPHLHFDPSPSHPIHPSICNQPSPPSHRVSLVSSVYYHICPTCLISLSSPIAACSQTVCLETYHHRLPPKGLLANGPWFFCSPCLVEREAQLRHYEDTAGTVLAFLSLPFAPSSYAFRHYLPVHHCFPFCFIACQRASPKGDSASICPRRPTHDVSALARPNSLSRSYFLALWLCALDIVVLPCLTLADVSHRHQMNTAASCCNTCPLTL